MVFIEVCVGSACHLKGAPEIVEMLENAVRENGLENEVVLSGSFCTGKCNRIGVTVTVNDTVYTGITRESFGNFWNTTVMNAVENDEQRSSPYA